MKTSFLALIAVIALLVVIGGVVWGGLPPSRIAGASAVPMIFTHPPTNAVFAVFLYPYPPCGTVRVGRGYKPLER